MKKLTLPKRSLKAHFNTLQKRYGEMSWWPADSPFEVMVGAILTQNTNWVNVERAIANLKAKGKLSAEAIVKSRHDHLAAWIKPSGYFNIKAKRLRAFCEWYQAEGGYEALSDRETNLLRHQLLAIHGVGPETADDMLLYAFERPVFVIDAYTRRIFSRIGLIDGDEGYEVLRAAFEAALGEDVVLFNQAHALIVEHAKQHCRTKPICENCPLVRNCQSAAAG